MLVRKLIWLIVVGLPPGLPPNCIVAAGARLRSAGLATRGCTSSADVCAKAEREEVLQRLHECFVLAVCQYLVGLRDEPPERSLTFYTYLLRPRPCGTVPGFQARTCVSKDGGHGGS